MTTCANCALYISVFFVQLCFCIKQFSSGIKCYTNSCLFIDAPYINSLKAHMMIGKIW